MPTVVIADDSPTLRRIVGAVLEREGFSVIACEDGVQAVQAVFRHQPDAVVLDVQMPRLSGYVAIRVLKDDWQTADIPTLLLTSLDAASDRYWGRLVGAERFLTKDFEAPDLVGAVTEAIAEADAARGGRERPVPDAVELSDDDVFGRVCDLLDRKLFESQVTAAVTAIPAEAHGFEDSVAAVLGVVGRIVDYDLASILMLEDSAAYLAVSRETSTRQYGEFLTAMAAAASQATGATTDVQQLSPRIADPSALLGADDEGAMATFLSMPLRARGRIVGILGLSSAAPSAFPEASLATLRLIDSPIAVVVDNARLHAANAAVS
jgi:twitching motility two-component system response regulator PilG